MDREFPETPKSELILRELLWFHHGCSNPCLYGDDGEMQCNSESHIEVWFIDFRRDSPALLQWKLRNREYRKMVPRPY